jgi:uncharacterized protein (DUF1800 family)
LLLPENSLLSERVEDAPVDSVQETPSAPEETTPKPSKLSRRGMLASLGTLAAGAAVTSAVTRPARAQEPPTYTPAMRSPYRAMEAALASTPEPVSLFVLATNRMGFGQRPGDYTEFSNLGADNEARFAAYVEQQLNPASIDDSACDAILTAQNFQTLGKSRQNLWQQHQRAQGLEWWERILPMTETHIATYYRAVYSKRQLQEVLVDFWHNHFNVYGWDTPSASTWASYDRDVIRANTLGNFRKMLGAVSQSISMLYFLDNISNSAGGPNENYARETFELHTMGSENYMGVIKAIGPNGEYQHPAPPLPDGVASKYVDEDVYNATLVFTGWRLDDETGQFYFDNAEHHKYSVNVLGKVIESGLGLASGDNLLDLLAFHPGTARYIARKLCRRLISDNPPETIVQAAADVFYAHRNASDQIRRTVRTILTSSEFRSAWGEKIKRPFEFIVSAIRATSANFAWSDSLDWRIDGLGQPLFGWRPPDGYPDRKEAWSSTMPMLQRWRFINWIMDSWTNESDVLRINILGQTPAEYKTSTSLVDYWSRRILARTLPPEESGPIVAFMASGKNPDAELPAEDISERAVLWSPLS